MGGGRRRTRRRAGLTLQSSSVQTLQRKREGGHEVEGSGAAG